MAPDELRSTVERVGDRFNLGEYEIDAYLTVLEQGQLTASEIADRTDIPSPECTIPSGVSATAASSNCANPVP